MKKIIINEGSLYRDILNFLNKQPVTAQIEDYINIQISPQVDHYKALFAENTQLFDDYLRREISNAEKVMTDIVFEIRHKNTYRTVIIAGTRFKLKNNEAEKTGVIEVAPELIEAYLWNRERIKYYTLELTGNRPRGRKSTELVLSNLFSTDDPGRTAKDVIYILTQNGYIERGTWINPPYYTSGNGFMFPFWVLWNTGYINTKTDKTALIKMWASLMGLPEPTKGQINPLRNPRENIKRTRLYCELKPILLFPY